MKLTWPLNKTGKGEYIQVCDLSLPLLIPNKNYIFLRRFSSKDDTSRLIATPYFADMVEADLIGVENHLNYIYRPNGHLDRNEILGLSALLNSNLFDTYFRTFNGNINVSATELREMPLPPLETIKQIGNAIILNNNFSQSIVDEVVEQFIEREKELSPNYE
jgi:adenine-specific DNA-methyltransferase